VIAVARAQGVDLPTLGAFGHLRSHDVIPGGVTRAMIERPRLPSLRSR
jgi:hypothetical protein